MATALRHQFHNLPTETVYMHIKSGEPDVSTGAAALVKSALEKHAGKPLEALEELTQELRKSVTARVMSNVSGFSLENSLLRDAIDQVLFEQIASALIQDSGKEA